MSQDWKKTIAALQMRLSEMIQQNNQLNGVIQKLKAQLEESAIQNHVNVSVEISSTADYIHYAGTE